MLVPVRNMARRGLGRNPVNRDAARLQVAQGINPAQAKEAARIEKQRAIAETLAANEQERQERLTVADLFTAWLADGVNRKDGNEGLRRYYGKDIAPRLGALELRELQEGHIRAMLKPTVAAGKVRTAQVLLLIVRQALSWAEKRQPWRPLLIAGNPADLITEDSITPPRLQERTRTGFKPRRNPRAGPGADQARPSAAEGANAMRPMDIVGHHLPGG